MTRSSPKIALTSVDLPTLGRPTIATLIVSGRSGSVDVLRVLSSVRRSAPGIAASAVSIIARTFSPCAEEIAIGSPKPSSWNSATARSGCNPSDLFTASTTGRPDLRSRSAISRSCGASPLRPSTKNTTTSHSAIACRVCLAISCRIPDVATGSKPPVSTTKYGWSPANARP